MSLIGLLSKMLLSGNHDQVQNPGYKRYALCYATCKREHYSRTPVSWSKFPPCFSSELALSRVMSRFSLCLFSRMTHVALFLPFPLSLFYSFPPLVLHLLHQGCTVEYRGKDFEMKGQNLEYDSHLLESTSDFWRDQGRLVELLCCLWKVLGHQHSLFVYQNGLPDASSQSRRLVLQ